MLIKMIGERRNVIIEFEHEIMRGFDLNDVVFINNARYEVVRRTHQMKNGKEIDEIELVPMPDLDEDDFDREGFEHVMAREDRHDELERLRAV
jgi:hypothetical protein